MLDSGDYVQFRGSTMQRTRIVWLVVVVALVVALVPSMPYGYYQVMRWVVSAAGVWLALEAHRRGCEAWTWCLAVIAGIYNPIVPVHASRTVWSVVNVATIAAITFYFFNVSKLQKESVS